MATNCAAPDCDEILSDNSPGVSLKEAPFWELVREDPETDNEVLSTHESLYFCSYACVSTWVEHDTDRP